MIMTCAMILELVYILPFEFDVLYFLKASLLHGVRFFARVQSDLTSSGYVLETALRLRRNRLRERRQMSRML